MKELIDLVNKKLDEYLPVSYPEEIFESMRYSLLAGGKRLRPIMCLEACRVFGGEMEKALPTACAFEMLHTQSLIHDDLPCMDNDDYRRGKLTNHKKFSESTAVLAGDALISYGTQLIIDKSDLPAETIVKVLREHAIAAGAYGIIAGQVVDIAMEGKPYDAKILEYIHTHKTADKEEGKLTYTALFGLEKAKHELNCLLDKAYDILKKQNIESEIFNSIINSIREKV